MRPTEIARDGAATSYTTPESNKYLPLGLRVKYLLNEPILDEEHNLVTADIDWEPDLSKYNARTARRLASESLTTTLPYAWPAKLISPLAWTTSSFPQMKEYCYQLTADDHVDIAAALAHFKSLGLEPSDVSRDTFPLPTLDTKLRSLSAELYHGKGFFVVRGLDPAKLSGEDNSLIFLGVSAHVADHQGRQDQRGRKIVHILDVTNASEDAKGVQSVYSNVAQPFHNDVFCDILALHTRACAEEGGSSILASAYTVYNEIAATRPDLIHVLAESDWTFDTFGRDPPYHQRALLYNHMGNMILNFSRRLLTGSANSPRTLRIPPMTEAQAEALDAVHFIAKTHSIQFKMQPGDLCYINNLAILHCRDAFKDGPNSKRHLARLWLRDTQRAWPIPPGLQMVSDRIYADLPDLECTWDLDPVLDDAIVRNARTSCGQG